MSYDLEVYGRSTLTSHQLGEIVDAHGLAASGQQIASRPAPVMLTSAATFVYAFTYSGPHRVEIDDLPHRHRRKLEAMKWLYRITVEGGEVPPSQAIVFAQRLAEQVDGVVVDLQTDISAEPEVEAVRVGTARYLHLEWYFQSDGESTSLLSDYIAASRDFLPVALPALFGTHHPLSERFREVGEIGLMEYYRRECSASQLFLKGNGPLVRGSVPEWSRSFIKTFALVFDLNASPALAPADLESFFVDVAQKSRSFFGCAEVNDSRVFTSVPSSPSGRWPGLPRIPQWMTWYSTEYALLVEPYLNGRKRSVDGGVVHLWADTPEPALQIASQIERAPWVPEKLLPQQKDSERKLLATSDARVMPVSLGGSPRGRTFLDRLLGEKPSE